MREGVESGKPLFWLMSDLGQVWKAFVRYYDITYPYMSIIPSVTNVTPGRKEKAKRLKYRSVRERNTNLVFPR